MTQQEFYDLRDKINEEQLPYKVVDRATIKYVGRTGSLDGNNSNDNTRNMGSNVISVQGANVLASDYVTEKLDDLTGFSRSQKYMVEKASGEEGVRDLRNYLTTASSVVNNTKLALVADPETRTVVDAIPVENELITSEHFFDVAELFMDANDLSPTVYEVGSSALSGITIHMGSNSPLVRAFSPGEDTLINSYYLKWNLGRIELGRYYERLVCSNGMVQKIQTHQSVITTLDADSVSALLSLPQNTAMLKEAFEDYSNNAKTAINSKASLNELALVSKMLGKQQVDPDIIKKIAPYEDEINTYYRAGYNSKQLNTRETISSVNVWSLFNGITHFASHNTIWAENDNRRSKLQADAIDFLRRPRDIKNYVDVYAGSSPVDPA